MRRAAVDVVKVDRSFVEGIDVNPVGSAIASAVLGLAAAVGMTAVAEGVETLTQLEHLEMLGCSIVKGYYVGRPMPALVIERLMTEQLGAPVRARAGARRLNRSSQTSPGPDAPRLQQVL